MADDVKIRVMGDFAIIHGRTSYTTADGNRLTARYTDCWAKTERPAGWRCRRMWRGDKRNTCVVPAERRDDDESHASNMITLRTVLPAFIAAKPSLISDSFSLAEIQSSRCSWPRM